MKYRLIILPILMLWTFFMMAQRRIVVYDLETRIPIRTARIWADLQFSDSTNYQGQATIPSQFDTLVVSKPNYIALRIPASAVKDSIPLLPKWNSISEVVIYGEDRTKKIQAAVDRWTKEEKREYALRNPKTGISFDLNRLFDFRGRHNRKQNERMKRVFKQMDDRENDPIIQAYKEMFGGSKK